MLFHCQNKTNNAVIIIIITGIFRVAQAATPPRDTVTFLFSFIEH